MDTVLKSIIAFGVTEAIFERGWVEQTPDEFVFSAKEEIFPYLKEAGITINPENLNAMILEELSSQLGDEYDVNIYRLKFFPSEIAPDSAV
jgi:hypothetical protein